ncbi:MAG: type I-C CRISPR-associated protein Cas8c/Csd1 [Peptococcales bacterium]|jgi:CRISPR-associated protein Csd1
MLNELANYAHKNNLISIPGFKEKNIKWVIVLSESGEFVAIEKTNRNFSTVPVLEQRELVGGSETRSHFLVDSAEVVLCLVEKEKPDKKSIKVRDKHQYFKKLLINASKEEPLLKVCSICLEDAQLLKQIQTHFKMIKGKKSDNITFKVGSIYPVDKDSWYKWWQDFRDSLGGKGYDQEESMICLLDGSKVTPMLSHSKVSGLNIVGGQQTGTAFVSFDKEAFQSFGLKQSQNAACSEEAVAIYRTALDNLIKNAPRPLAGALYLHWYKESIPLECDLLKDWDEKEDNISIRNAIENANRLIKAANEGIHPQLLNNRYYILVLSGAGGRIMVRDWLQGDYAELTKNMQQWFNDLSIISSNGRGKLEYVKFWAYLVRLVAYRKGEKIQNLSERIDKELAPLMPRIWRSIVRGNILPDTVASRSLAYLRSEMLDSGDENSKQVDNLDSLACSLLKAWYIRKNKSKGGIVHMDVELNLAHPSVAYHAGRMMAVLAEVQKAALGDVGAGIVQRYYAAASSTPALVLGRLIRQAQFHLSKLENKGQSIWYEKLLQEISEKVGDSLPKTLNLEEQTLFALGYYQQKAHMYKPTEKNVSSHEKN